MTSNLFNKNKIKNYLTKYVFIFNKRALIFFCYIFLTLVSERRNMKDRAREKVR